MDEFALNENYIFLNSIWLCWPLAPFVMHKTTSYQIRYGFAGLWLLSHCTDTVQNCQDSLDALLSEMLLIIILLRYLQ